MCKSKNKNNRYSKGKNNLVPILIAALVIIAAIIVIFAVVQDKSKSSLSMPGTAKGVYTIAPEEKDWSSTRTDIPEFSGEDYITLNNNIPGFTEDDIKNIEGEHYSELDDLGRCGPASAKLHNSMMPTEERGSIGEVKPSGWKQAKYEGIINSEPPYLYNRSHLIAFALTGQNANKLNLITGTRHMNAETMLPWEEKVMKYLDNSDNHVLYRVTPYFVDDELVARGVEMEAYSIEDEGEGICYHVFIYNYQPGIEIDYKTGDSKVA